MLTPSKFALQCIYKQGTNSLIFFLLVFITSACLYGVGFFTKNMQTGVEQAASHINADIIAVPSEYSDNAKGVLFEGAACTILFPSDPTDILKSINGVDQVSCQLFLRTLQMPCCAAAGVQIIAIDTDTDFAVGENLKSMGLNTLTADELIAGSGCGLAKGTKVSFYDRQFTVADVLEETGMGYDRSVFISFEAADLITVDEQYSEYFDQRTGLSSMALIKIADGADTEQVKKAVNEKLAEQGITAYSVDIMSQNLIKQLDYFRSFGAVMDIFVILLASVSLFSLVSLSFRRRRNRVGSMLSVGITRNRIIGMFLLEYLYLTLLGAFAGIGLSMIVVLPLHDVIKQAVDMPYKFIGMGNMCLLALYVIFIDLVMLLLACSTSFADMIRTEPAILTEEQV